MKCECQSVSSLINAIETIHNHDTETNPHQTQSRHASTTVNRRPKKHRIPETFHKDFHYLLEPQPRISTSSEIIELGRFFKLASYSLLPITKFSADRIASIVSYNAFSCNWLKKRIRCVVEEAAQLHYL